jgi:cell filamentation protein, protein adenylyltransferase
MADVHRRLTQSGFLKGLNPDDFAQQAGVIMGDVNYVHPFREGNGRTHAQFLKQLAAQAGHALDLRRIGPFGSKRPWQATGPTIP